MISKAVTVAVKCRLAEFDRASTDPAGTQRRVLRRLLRRAATTEWGGKFRFSGIDAPEEFRAAVPITPYERAAIDWHRAFDGARNVTWPGHIPYFALSSGTTAGNKLLPVTYDAVRSNRRAGAIVLAVMAGTGGMKRLLGGKSMYLGGSTTLRRRGHCLYGDASGIVARHMPFYARSRYLPGADVARETNWEEKIRMIVQRYCETDVRMLSACPSWAAMLFKEMRRTCGKDVGAIWPELSYFISYGMAFGPYKQSFAEYIGRKIRCIDTYSSSEGGMTAVQEEPGGPMRMIIDNGVYFEFVPADRISLPDPPRLHIGEVERNIDYAVVISTNGGIWAYPLGDVIRFETISPPRIVFAGRTQINLSAFGEHVTLRMMENAVTKACDATSAAVADYTVWPRYPAPDTPTPAHRWIIDFDRQPDNDETFMNILDRSIREESEDYDTHRTDDYGLTPPVLIRVAPGTFYAWMKRKGKLGGQHKVPRVVASEDMARELLEISGAGPNEAADTRHEP